MDRVVAYIVALSAPSDINQLASMLKSDSTLSAGPPSQEDLASALEALNPAHHSLGYLFILDATARGPIARAADREAFISAAAQLLTVAQAFQVQAAPDVFAHLCRRLKECAIDANCPRRGIAPLQHAIVKLRPTKEHLTPMHADLFQLCLLSRCYSAALPFVEDDVFDVEPARTAVTPTDLYLYCYYGGMVCIGRKRLARALELLLQAVTAPSIVSNAIVLAAYKKMVLASLIHTGSVPPLPRFTSGRVRAMVESEARPYAELAQAYATGNVDRLRRVAEQHGAVWRQDTTVGLVSQVLSSLAKRSIQQLTQTYVTLSLADIAAAAGLASPAEAEASILRMVEEGEIFATINQRDGMVRFSEDPCQFNTAAMARQIDAHVRRCMQLAQRVQAANDAVSSDKAYLTKVTAKERTRYDASDELAGSQGLYQP